MGGHVLCDAHASRVLPGYKADNKIRLIKKLKDKIAIIYCVSAKEIEKNITWSDSGLTLEDYALKEIKEFRENGLNVVAIAINRLENETKALAFIERLKKLKENFVISTEIGGYPKSIKNIFGPNGFEKQPLIELKEPLIIVTGAGANNGKMFLALSQIYQLKKKGIDAGFAKFETFPIWNLQIKHEVNIAYEAATADIKDKLLIDPFHKKAYGINAVNYNRDIENFAILKKIIDKISSRTNYMNNYKSPTDMGLNMAKEGIINDKKIREASIKEIYRRAKIYQEKFKAKDTTKSTLLRMDRIIDKIVKH